MASDRDTFQIIGNSGLRHQQGRLTTYNDPLAILSGQAGRRIIQTMVQTDPIIHGTFLAITMLIRQAQWSVEPYSDKPADKAAAQFLEECRNDMNVPWTDFIDEVLSMLEYGFSLHEIVYKRRQGLNADPTKRSLFDDGRIGWRKLEIRAQDTITRWIIDDDGGISGAVQMAPPDFREVTIPIEKALLFRTTLRQNSPEGRTLLMGSYRPWYAKTHIENIEGIGVERDLAGLPIAYGPPELFHPDASPEHAAVMAHLTKIVQDIRNDAQGGLVFPRSYDEHGNAHYELALLSAGGSRMFDTDKIIGRYDLRMAQSILADFIMIGHESVGSFALSSDKTQLFGFALQAWLDSIAAVLNRHAVPRLFQLNGMDTQRLPRLTAGNIERQNLQELGAFLTAMAGAGMTLFPDDSLDAWVREQAGLPEKSPEALAAQKEAQQQAPPAPAGDGGRDPEMADAAGDALADDELAARRGSKTAAEFFAGYDLEWDDDRRMFHLKHNQKDHAPNSKGKVPVGAFKAGMDGPDMGVLGQWNPSNKPQSVLQAKLTEAGFDEAYVKTLTVQQCKDVTHYFKGTGPFKDDDTPFEIKTKAFGGSATGTGTGDTTATGTGTAKGHNFAKKDAAAMRAEMAPQWQKVSFAEQSGFKAYQGSAYVEQNAVLRGKAYNKYDKTPFSSYQISQANQRNDVMAGALKKMETQSDMVVFKGTRIPDKPQNLIGQKITDKGFNSTSLRARTAKGFKPGEPPPSGVLKIQVPKGSNAAYVDAMPGNNDWEYELILPPGSSYLVTGVDSYGNVEAEYIAPDGYK